MTYSKHFAIHYEVGAGINHYEVGAGIMLILQIRKLRPRDVQKFNQGLRSTMGKTWIWTRAPDSEPMPMLLLLR